MTVSESIGLFILCVVAYVLANELVRVPHMSRLSDRLTCERNRNRFGELRTELVRRLVADELDPRSPLFVTMYRALTLLMRNPHDYERAARVVLTTLPEPQEAAPGPARPTKTEGLLAEESARRFDLLCRDYSRLYRAGAFVLDRVASKPSAPLWILWMAARAQEHRAPSIVAARARLERTAKLAAAA